jgi:hypothetical protein
MLRILSTAYGLVTVTNVWISKEVKNVKILLGNLSLVFTPVLASGKRSQARYKIVVKMTAKFIRK